MASSQNRQKSRREAGGDVCRISAMGGGMGTRNPKAADNAVKLLGSTGEYKIHKFCKRYMQLDTRLS